MRYRNRFETRKTALQALTEEQSWTCACGTMLEDDQERLCRQCKSYQEDLLAFVWELDQ